jgi:hypothetical protein
MSDETVYSHNAESAPKHRMTLAKTRFCGQNKILPIENPFRRRANVISLPHIISRIPG